MNTPRAKIPASAIGPIMHVAGQGGHGQPQTRAVPLERRVRQLSQRDNVHRSSTSQSVRKTCTNLVCA